MEAVPKELRIYVTENGQEPFSEWLASLRDSRVRAKIRVRLDRVSLGNLGDCHSVGEGVQELRVDYGPGYRVYFGQEGTTIVLLLCGGDKSTQSRDIKTAQIHWKEYRRRA
ncbi:MAG TPA: type II toxin-antitoxin system RelE/ParE family toxin [Nitrospira sp.]|nr:type II toxin-antitoxin system RelE/ParE family toxin [Nitrospira sp.]